MGVGAGSLALARTRARPVTNSYSALEFRRFHDRGNYVIGLSAITVRSSGSGSGTRKELIGTQTFRGRRRSEVGSHARRVTGGWLGPEAGR
jgi:hypothetical protein